MALLGLGPMSAYDVKKAMATSVNFFWTAAHSQVYQQARRLVRDGYVEEAGPGNARGRRTLSLTTAGREALGAWLRSPAPLVRSYDEATAKLFFGDQSDLPSLIAMLEDQASQHSQHGDQRGQVGLVTEEQLGGGLVVGAHQRRR